MKNRPHPALLNSVTAAAIAASALIPFAPRAAARETITPIINPTIESKPPLATLQHPPRYTLRAGEKPLNFLVFDNDSPRKERNYTHGSGFVIPAIMRTLGAPGDGLYRVTFYDIKDDELNAKGDELNAAIQSALDQKQDHHGG